MKHVSVFCNSLLCLSLFFTGLVFASEEESVPKGVCSAESQEKMQGHFAGLKRCYGKGISDLVEQIKEKYALVCENSEKAGKLSKGVKQGSSKILDNVRTRIFSKTSTQGLSEGGKDLKNAGEIHRENEEELKAAIALAEELVTKVEGHVDGKDEHLGEAQGILEVLKQGAEEEEELAEEAEEMAGAMEAASSESTSSFTDPKESDEDDKEAEADPKADEASVLKEGEITKIDDPSPDSSFDFPAEDENTGFFTEEETNGGGGFGTGVGP